MSYDNYLNQMIDDYNSECEPKQVTIDGFYNCHECNNTKCENWSKHNEID